MKTPAAGRAGVTLLELMVASVVFMIFLGGLSSVWNSLEKQRLHVQARTRLDAEALVARAQLVADISSSTTVASWTGADLSMAYASDGSTVTYSVGPGNQLLRYESSTISTTTAALFLDSISTEAANGALHIRCAFSKKPFPASSSTLSTALDLWWKAL